MITCRRNEVSISAKNIAYSCIFGFLFSGPSQLTASALSKHDAENSDIIEQQDDTATFKTWATNYTECTNKTFNKVHQNWQNDAVHKEVCCNIKCCINDAAIKC